MQIIVEVEVEAGVYASEQYQSRINAPSVCPNCGMAQSLEAHGYYWRWVSEGSLRRGITNGGAPFLCRCCAVTVSCPPRFAQPYQVVCNATIEAFFESRTARSDVRVGRAFRALPTSLPAVVWDAAHGVWGVLRSIPAGGNRSSF